jgi:hypothetical protein
VGPARNGLLTGLSKDCGLMSRDADDDVEALGDDQRPRLARKLATSLTCGSMSGRLF